MPLTAREAVGLIFAKGGKLVRHGAGHDAFQMPNGMLIQIRRHGCRLAPGAGRDNVWCGPAGGAQRRKRKKRMKYLYEAIVEPAGDFLEARFPDLGIITQGNDLQDVAFMAQDLLENHIVMALQQGVVLPSPSFGHPCGARGYRLGVVVDCAADTPQDETMSVGEAAAILDVSEARVRAMVRDGILSSRKAGTVPMVDAQSVIRRFNEPAGPGRPRKDQAIA